MDVVSPKRDLHLQIEEGHRGFDNGDNRLKGIDGIDFVLKESFRTQLRNSKWKTYASSMFHPDVETMVTGLQ